MECRICGNTEQNQSYRIHEMMFGLDDAFTYFQCSLCQCLQIDIIPADMSRYYPADYYSFSAQSFKQHGNLLRKSWRRIKNYYSLFPNRPGGRLFNYIFKRGKYELLSYIPVNRNSRILDVGCGTGWYLYGLREVGFRNLLGIDPFLDHDIEYENGLQIRKVSLTELQGEYDVIMFHHSFEHIANQLEILRAASRLLSASGVCMIRIPVVPSYAWAHYREHWVQLDAPRHYYLHSIDSMNILVRQAGLNIDKIIYDSTKLQFEGSELYRRGKTFVSNSDGKFFSKSQREHWSQESKKLNLLHRGDQAAFYLKNSNM